MANDIIITPSSASIQFSASYESRIALKVEASGSLNFIGKSGSLFAIEDTLSGSLMSVSDVSGLPILEVFSDNGVHIGRFNAEAIDVKPGGQDVSFGSGSVLFVSSSRKVGINTTNVTNSLDVAGNISCSVISASAFFGPATASFAATSSWALNGGTTLITASTYPITASWATFGGTQLNTASTYQITASWARSSSLSSYAYSSSYASTAGVTAFAESSDFSLDSNYSYSASYAATCSVTFLVTESVFSSSYIESSSWASGSTSASWADFAGSSSWAETASFATNAAGGGLDILAVQVFS